MDIDQHLFFVRSSFLLSNLRCDKFRKSYSGLKYFLALIFSFFAAFSQFSSLYILRYSHKLPIGLLCMEIVLYRCQLAIELRNGVFIWILGHFLRASIGQKSCHSHAFVASPRMRYACLAGEWEGYVHTKAVAFTFCFWGKSDKLITQIRLKIRIIWILGTTDSKIEGWGGWWVLDLLSSNLTLTLNPT